MPISIILIIISIFSLAFAYSSEHFFGLLPCILCIYQRIPYFIIILFAAISLIFRGKMRRILIFACGLLFLVEAGIAGFHVGVEKGLWKLEDGCQSSDPIPTTLEEMRNQIIGKPAAPCDKPQFIFLGLSMAAWNLLFSGFWAVVTLVLLFRGGRRSSRNLVALK